MNVMTSRMPIAPAMRLWARNCSPRVALICWADTSWIGNGSEPNLRIVTSSLASAAVNPPMPPAEIWTWPPGMGSLMTGAEMTLPSRTMAKYSPTCSVVYSANSAAPSSFKSKLTVRPWVSLWPRVADDTWSPLNSGG